MTGEVESCPLKNTSGVDQAVCAVALSNLLLIDCPQALGTLGLTRRKCLAVA